MHDIAGTVAELERFKHLVSGGYLMNEWSNTWMKAGSSIANFLKSDEEFQRRLGWTNVINSWFLVRPVMTLVESSALTDILNR